MELVYSKPMDHLGLVAGMIDEFTIQENQCIIMRLPYFQFAAFVPDQFCTVQHQALVLVKVLHGFGLCTDNWWGQMIPDGGHVTHGYRRDPDP